MEDRECNQECHICDEGECPFHPENEDFTEKELLSESGKSYHKCYNPSLCRKQSRENQKLKEEIEDYKAVQAEMEYGSSLSNDEIFILKQRIKELEERIIKKNYALTEFIRAFTGALDFIEVLEEYEKAYNKLNKEK